MKNMFIIGLFLTSLLQSAASSETLLRERLLSAKQFKQDVNSFINNGRFKEMQHFDVAKALTSATCILRNTDDEKKRIAHSAWKQDKLPLAASIQFPGIKPEVIPFAAIFYPAIAFNDFDVISFLFNPTTKAAKAVATIYLQSSLNDVLSVCNSAEMFAFLLKDGIDINVPINENGETLLHKTVLKPDREFMTFLLSKKANLNAQDNRGFTPLLNLVVTPCLEDLQTLHTGEVLARTQILVDAGTDLGLRTTSGKSVQELVYLCRTKPVGAKLDEYFGTIKPLILQPEPSA